MIGKSIRNGNDLIEWFFGLSKHNQTHMQLKMLNNGINVDSEIRKEILISEDQGRITIRGQVMMIKFKSLGGGVWLSTLGELR